MDIINGPYRPSQKTVETFGDHWCGPESTAPWEEVLVARYKCDPPGSDGQPVEVYMTMAPAEFFRVKALPDKAFDGKEIPGFQMGTGSGAAKLAHDMALAISEGMLGLEELDEE